MIQSEQNTYYAERDFIINPSPEQQALTNYLCTIRGICHTLQMGQIIEAYLDPSDSARWLSRLSSWSHGPLIPIRIILRDFAEFDGIQKATTGTTAVFLNYLTRLLGMYEQARPSMEKALNEGNAILLFDGLDGVVEEPVLSRVVETIQAVRTTYPKGPVLVTCRIMDYEANPKRQIAGFTRETLEELSDEQIEAFVEAWYAEIDRT